MPVVARAYWKGFLRLSLVTVNVEIYPAIDTSTDISFRQIHQPSGQRVRYQKVVPGIGEVETSDIVKGFEPTRIALARIAKEGRKYGCYLGCVTQRPGELDPTILSQCSTIFAMRLANEADQKIIGTAIGDTSASNLAFLPTMAQREAIAFGEAVSTPMRLMFEMLTPDHLPATDLDLEQRERRANGADIELTRIIHRMRNSEMDQIELETVEDFENELGFIDDFSQRRRLTDYVEAAPDNGMRTGRRTSDAPHRPFGGRS